MVGRVLVDPVVLFWNKSRTYWRRDRSKALLSENFMNVDEAKEVTRYSCRRQSVLAAHPFGKWPR